VLIDEDIAIVVKTLTMQEYDINNLTIVKDEGNRAHTNKAYTIWIWYNKEQLVILV
jgi:hypothetical protein